jgi:2-polyprenyl-3-methyl-5-hydroxy-6-metoxy-1,4-benzoquinol methylase
MNRKEKIIRHINKYGYGIEIGPSHNPIAPKKEGFKVHIVDHLNREQLIAKYKEHHVNLENIEEVDFVWQGGNYLELTGKSKYYDWIIASYVIEHTPDFIGFLNSCDAVLKDEGVISLVVPDKRYCFDHYRPITGISKILDNHFLGNKVEVLSKL